MNPSPQTPARPARRRPLRVDGVVGPADGRTARPSLTATLGTVPATHRSVRRTKKTATLTGAVFCFAEPGGPAPLTQAGPAQRLQRANVRCLQALRALLDFKLNALVFGQAAEAAVVADFAEVSEEVLAAVFRRDEAEALADLRRHGQRHSRNVEPGVQTWTGLMKPCRQSDRMTSGGTGVRPCGNGLVHVCARNVTAIEPKVRFARRGTLSLSRGRSPAYAGTGSVAIIVWLRLSRLASAKWSQSTCSTMWWWVVGRRVVCWRRV